MAGFRPALSAISPSLQHEQGMANWISKQKSIASSRGPHYAHRLNPKLSDRPWMPPTAERVSARNSWVDFPNHARRTSPPQDLNIQRFDLYQIRFLFEAELRIACDNIGCLAHQSSHLSTILNLSIAESAG